MSQWEWRQEQEELKARANEILRQRYLESLRFTVAELGRQMGQLKETE